MPQIKERLDKLLVDRGLAETRTRAQALIMAGKVKVDGERITKAGTQLSPDHFIEVESVSLWASRGAFKLLKALDSFGIDVTNSICVDMGASTGGFTDVLLNRGCKKVYAVDVGYGQLHWRLASDARVVVMDRTNARNLTSGDFEDTIDFLTCDASFISLKLLLPAIDRVLSDSGGAVALIKPQFEVGRERLGRGGVVREPELHIAAIEGVFTFIESETRLYTTNLTCSPLLGPEGNMEFLCHLQKEASGKKELDIAALVCEAHTEFVQSTSRKKEPQESI